MPNEILTKERPQPSRQMLQSGNHLSITADGFYHVLQTYPQEQRDPLAFWFDLAKDRSWKLTELAKQSGVSSTTISRLFRGKYEGDVAGQIARLAQAMESWSEVIGNPDFIMTSLAKKMFAVFDKTRALRNVTLMWGPKGIGKSCNIDEYTRRNNHGLTFAVRCPAYGCSIHEFVKHVAETLRIFPGRKSRFRLSQEIAKMLAKGNRLLIIDELHEVFKTCGPTSIIRICEWLRELQDVSECGLVLTGTELLKHEFFHGIHADVLAQLVDRGTVQIPLNNKPTKGDILAIMRHYGLDFPGHNDPEAATIVNDILKSSGLRKLTLHLRDGASAANKRKEENTWTHFVDAFEAIQSMSK